MKRWPVVFLFLLAFVSLQSQDSKYYFLSNPCLTPDGATVIFSFEGDLWKAAVSDGMATRLTAMEGYETNPRVSPDGKWLAFTGRQKGNADIYLMPLNGGEIKQLTFHSAGDETDSWSWDSRYIYFTSSRYSRMGGYKTGIDGGTPQRVFGDNFFLYDHGLTEHPQSGELFFDDTWESSNQAQRKRYKGPFNPDIQSYNLRTGQYKQYTNWVGKDFGVTIDRKGSLYFISDEENGEYNLYTFANDKKTPLTHFPTSIRSPQVNAEGGKVVFEKDYQLWLYDVSSKKAAKLAIQITRNDVLEADKDYNVKGKISAFDASPDGKKLAFISRGELFVSDAEGKFIKKIDRGSAERVMEVKWMEDSKTLLFSQTLDGYLNLYTTAADGNGKIKQLTSDRKNNRNLAMNRKRTKLVYLCGRDEVRLMDMKTEKNQLLVKEEIWGFQNSGPGFSPGDEYIVFTAFRNFEQDIFVHNLKNNTTTDITNTGITEADPVWSPDGKFIYFVSQRLEPAYPFGMSNAKVYRLPLQKTDDPFRVNRFDSLFVEAKKDTTKKAETKKDSLASSKPIVIDMNKIMERMEQVGPGFGRQGLLSVVDKGEKSFVLLVSNHEEGKPALYKITYEPFEKIKTDKIAGTAGSSYSLAEAKDKYYLLSGGTIHKLNLDGNKTEAISTDYTFRRNLEGEFNQMFYEAWAQMEENYYDAGFHGLNWEKTKNHYKQFLPYLNTRGDLRILLNDMLGELNSSHQGFSSFGSDEEVKLSSRTMETGILFDEQDPYRVKNIVARSAADHTGKDVQAGDLLVKVNDVSVQKNRNRNFYFTNPSGDNELKLTFSRSGKLIDVLFHPESGLLNNLYDEWIDKNRETVDKKGKGEIAYSYMKNMGGGELDNFIIDMTKELIGKKGLILDLRYNTGGNVHDKVLNFLSRRSYLQWKYRDGKPTTQANFTPSDMPIVLLINEQSLSDAEMTSAGFKALGLGKIVGNETYHWIIFTSGAGLVDGSFIRMPAWGCYTLDGKDLEQTGVTPDILVINTFTDKLTGKDPQLDRAIEEIMKQIK